MQMGESIGGNIRRLRKEKRMTLKDMSQLTGISVQALSNYEKGSRTAGLEKVILMADALGAKLEDVLGTSQKAASIMRALNAWKNRKGYDCLKPCPFCGNKPTMITRRGEDGWRDRFYVLCSYEDGGCGAEGGWYHTEAEAAEAWNRREGKECLIV